MQNCKCFDAGRGTKNLHSAFCILHFPEKCALTKIRTYGLIPPVRSVSTRRDRSRQAGDDPPAMSYAPQSVGVAHFHDDFSTDGSRVFNAKSQRREGAKSFFLLGVSAPSRLCVKRPVESRPAVVQYSLVAAGRFTPFASFHGKSTQAIIHQQLTSQRQPWPIRLNCAKSSLIVLFLCPTSASVCFHPQFSSSGLRLAALCPFRPIPLHRAIPCLPANSLSGPFPMKVTEGH
jgi:hypothetical protein